MRREHLFLIVVGIVFFGLAAIFALCPRSTYSELERRELARFPEFSVNSLFSGQWTRDIGSWFSDSQPGRDLFMNVSMEFKKLIGVRAGDDALSFRAADGAVDMGMIETPTDAMDGDTPVTADPQQSERDINEISTPVMLDDNAKIANAGIIITGSGDNVRALMAYGGSGRGGNGYARIANLYHETFGSDVTIYCMVIPTAAEFYTPDKAKRYTNPQLPTIRNIYSQLHPDVKAVDVYTALGEHAAEDIYLRTDHHWAPLGAYYAARKLAAVAGVPFSDISEYTRGSVKQFVGTMYGYSQDPAVRDAPEEFVYWIPEHLPYVTTYIDYNIDKETGAVREGKPHKGEFFHRHKDGSSQAYLTFMGGDYKLTKVETGVTNGRRLVIIKDSFGNALPGWLFGSFEQIHVIDHRYFRHSLPEYVSQNGITDILMANNIFNAYSDGVCAQYKRMLKGGYVKPAAAKTDSTKKAEADTARTVSIPQTVSASDSVSAESQQPDTINVL